jgi:hypothetical protein
LKKQGNLFFDPKNGFFGTKKVETALISRAISTSATQRYKIPKRNANPLTLVNTNIISHFSSFFAYKKDHDFAFNLINAKHGSTKGHADNCEVMTFTFQRCYKERTTTLFAVKVALTEVKSHLNLAIFAFQKTAFHFFVVSLSDINNKMRARTTCCGA